MSARRAEGAVLALVLGLAGAACGGSRPPPAAGGPSGAVAEVTRYRLLLAGNPVDPGGALRCYSDCQSRETPEAYIECLAGCPGFEQTPGVECAPSEVPPAAACFTARPVQGGSEPQRGSVVIAVIGDVPVAVGLAAVCASQTEPCSYAGGVVP